ncbi:MAG: ABC transporter permease [Acidobacteriota bacterium]|nr:MAG: ABC transporter permease [Acidobacteriota bacterium]
MRKVMRSPWLWLVRFIGLIVPQRMRVDWRQEWEAELRWRERQLAEWDRLDGRNKLALLWHSAGAFMDALWLQPRRWEDEVIQDLRYGARMLFKQPGFSLVVILTLALGIGVNTASFTVFNALVLKPLPIRDVDSLVEVQKTPESSRHGRRYSYPDYQDYVARTRTMSGLALISEIGATLGLEYARQGETQREEFGYVNCQLVSSNYFSLLGANMLMGRGFTAEEELTPNTHPVAVLSHYFWERAFNSDPAVIGKTIKLSGQSFVIVGVTAGDFIGTAPNRPACWVPLMMRDALFQQTEPRASGWPTDRNEASFSMWGRMKPGVTTAQAEAEMTALTDQLMREYPGETRKATVQLKRAPGFVSVDEEVGQIFLILPVSVGLVLLIACANVANLMLARAAGRQKEIGTRLALGATRRRIVRQLLTESLLLASAGGVIGLLLTWWALNILYPVLLSQFVLSSNFLASMAIDLEPDYRVFGFTVLMALLTGIAAGLAPALQSSRPDLTVSLKGEGSLFGEQMSQSRLRNGLIVVQLAFSLMLLVSAGLLARNLQKLQTIDTGFETGRLFALEVDLGFTRARQTETLRRQLEARLRAMPEVQSVSRASRAPLSGQAPETAVALAGQSDGLPEVSYDFVSSHHLETLGVPMSSGRNFSEQEADAGAHVVVVNAAVVRKLWPHFNDPGQAVGQTVGIEAGDIRLVEAPNANASPSSFPVYQVVGVARDTLTGIVFRGADPLIYLPLGSSSPQGSHLLVRTRSDANRVMANVRTEIAALNPDATLAMKPTAEWLDLQTTPFRIASNIALALGIAAILMASIGLYGAMSFVVAQRTREVGIRVALGAESRGILTLFLRQAMRLIGAGMVLGLLGSVLVARLLRLVLVEMSPFDPLAFGGVSLCLLLVALLATYIPARRATKIEPMIALRRD